MKLIFFKIFFLFILTIGLIGSASFVVHAQTPGETLEKQVKPNLSIPDFDLQFSDITVTTTTVGNTSVRTLDIPYLGQYIASLYKYAVAVSGLFAVVLMMIGGFQYMVARDTGLTKKGMDRIKHALIGLGLTLFAFLILKTVNPDLVALNALKIESVTKLDYEDAIQEELGSLGDVDAFNATEQFLPDVVDGKFRATMFEACGDKKGMSLPTYEAKMDRLKKIVSVWAEVGANQGGAIYINGGNAGCTYSIPNINFVIASLANTKLTGTSSDPFKNPAIDATCRQILQEEIDYNANADRVEAEYKAAVKAKAKPLPPKPLSGKEFAKVLIEKYRLTKDSPCYIALHAHYDQIYTQRAKEAGLLCGDCGSTIASLYECFDPAAGKISRDHNGFGQGCGPVSGRVGEPYVPGCNLVNPTTAQIDNCVKNLRFGDVFGTSKHVFMYTGKGGLPFEILEMGGGGSADITCEDCGGKLASKIAGLPATLSGMRASVSATSFFKGKAGSGKCLYAWRPIKP
jgi:hypothetical protein